MSIYLEQEKKIEELGRIITFLTINLTLINLAVTGWVIWRFVL